MPSTLTFAVPVAWNQQTAYEINTIVFIGKKAYTAIQNVPAGTNITNTDYWIETGVTNSDVSELRDQLNALADDVSDNTADIATNTASIVSLGNQLTTVSNNLATATANLADATQRLDNIMITLYTPPASS